MQEKGCHVFAAESEAELEEWVAALKKVIHTEYSAVYRSTHARTSDLIL